MSTSGSHCERAGTKYLSVFLFMRVLAVQAWVYFFLYSFFYKKEIVKNDFSNFSSGIFFDYKIKLGIGTVMGIGSSTETIGEPLN